MQNGQTKVFIVDDHADTRASLRQLVDLEPDLQVCGEAGSVEAAISGIEEAHPDVALLDVNLGTGTGLDVLAGLCRKACQVPVLFLSMYSEAVYAEMVLQKGARGYLMKSESPDRVLEGIRAVVQKKICVSPKMAARLKEKGWAL